VRTDVTDEVPGKTVSHVMRPYARRLEIHFADDSVLAGADLTEGEREAFVRWDPRRLNELGGSLHLLVSISRLGRH
jgi:hypothetical protein